MTTHSAHHQDYQPPPVDYLEVMYSELAATGQAALFVGEVHGEPVAADLVTRCGAIVRGWLAGFDRTGEASQRPQMVPKPARSRSAPNRRIGWRTVLP